MRAAFRWSATVTTTARLRGPGSRRPETAVLPWRSRPMGFRHPEAEFRFAVQALPVTLAGSPGRGIPHMRFYIIAASLLVLGLLASLAGCGSGGLSTRPGFGSVRVSLTDAPARFEKVNIVIREVHIHRAGDGDDAWLVVRPDSATTYNLVALQNGVFATLGLANDIPAGT